MGHAGQVSTSTHDSFQQCLWMASGSRMMTPVSFFQVRGWSESHLPRDEPRFVDTDAGQL